MKLYDVEYIRTCTAFAPIGSMIIWVISFRSMNESFAIHGMTERASNFAPDEKKRLHDSIPAFVKCSVSAPYVILLKLLFCVKKERRNMKDKLILRNGMEIELESGASLSVMKVLSVTKEEMMRVWDSLTEENLKSVSVMNGDGVTVATYSDLLLVYETSEIRTDGKVLTSFNLREKTDVEKRLDFLEESAEVHDSAIYDLGEAVSGLAEEGGLS